MPPTFINKPKPLVLIIIDGLGVAPPEPGNAVTLAKPKMLDSLWPRYYHGYLHASGADVGLPQGADGNSEVGHMHLGAGKVIFQDLPRIDMAINNGNFFTNPVLVNLITNVKKNKSKFHIMGCVGGGLVHSSLSHFFAVIQFAKQNGLTGGDLVIHAFTDGRDSAPRSAEIYLEQLENECKRQGVGKIGTIIGRYFGMDRDERWERVQKAYELITEGKGEQIKSWKDAIDASYKKDLTDEYLEPAVIMDGDKPVGLIGENDSVLHMNYRPDRAIQLTTVFVQDDFNFFKRVLPNNISFAAMVEYEKGWPKNAAFPQERIQLPFGRIIADAGLRQLRITESEKYPHVTYFFDGGVELQYRGEDRVDIPSPKDVATYDQKPEMSTYLVTDELIRRIGMSIYDFILVNFANVDMVGHTGVIPAAVRAVQVVDECINKIVSQVISLGGCVIITADHGNTEEMINLVTGEIDTKHSINPVPIIIAAEGLLPKELRFGKLSDVAPTMLKILQIEKPFEMTGRSLID